MDNHFPFSRSQVASWASVVGALALVSGGLLFAFQGELSPVVFGCVMVGILGIGLWIGWAPDEFQAWMAGRQTRYGTTTILVTILFLGVIVFVYGMVDRANITADFTTQQKYSLNTPTLNVIERLRERGFRVRLVGFFSRNKMREQESADLLLRQYEAEGGDAVEVEFVDPDEKPDIAGRFGYQPGYDGHMFLAVLGADGEPDAQSVPIYLGEVNERNITTGLLTVASAGLFKIYFTVGHGELDLEQTDEPGISRLGTSLLDQGIIVQSLQLLDMVETGIPEDASAVLIIGAQQPFVETEVEVIRDYMDRGGRLAIFTDPPLVDSYENNFLRADSPFNTYLWDEYGIRVKDELIVEKQSNLGSDFTLIADQIVSHTILSGFQDAPIVMRLVRTLEITDDPQGRQSMYVREPLLLSSEGSYGESGLEEMAESFRTVQDEADTPGPLLMGMTVRRSLEFQLENQPRLFIIGDSDVVKNEFVSEFPGNAVLWSDAIDWLTGFSQTVSFTPINDPTLLTLIVSDQQRTTIAYVTMVIMPGIVLLSGIVVWWYRRR
ncbi:MAG: GldG family protein [Anaerolineae bacterium]|nr:GldG family protein [Anaerolineae bacterium]